jgi:hypothetical protein
MTKTGNKELSNRRTQTVNKINKSMPNFRLIELKVFHREWSRIFVLVLGSQTICWCDHGSDNELHFFSPLLTLPICINCMGFKK